MEVATVLGGGSVLYQVLRGSVPVVRHVQSTLENRSALKDFYYTSVNHACRIIKHEHEYMSVRRVGMVALQAGLQTVPVATRFTANVKIVDTVIPDTHTIIPDQEAPRANNWAHPKLKFQQPLKRNEHAQFTHIRNITSESPLRNYLGWRSDHRVDHLVLRVVFVEKMPAEVTFTEETGEHHTIKSEIIKPDVATLEFSKIIDKPVLQRYYQLAWRFA